MESPESPKGSRHDSEYQDPHYHDDGDVEPPAEDEEQTNRPSVKRKLPRRMPPPRRRYEE